MTANRPLETYEIGSPWVTFTYLTTDLTTRITGRSKIMMQCSICGASELAKLRIPRFGKVPIPKGGRHPVRVDFVRRHQHTATERLDRRLWRLPFRNLTVPVPHVFFPPSTTVNLHPTDEDIRKIINRTLGREPDA